MTEDHEVDAKYRAQLHAVALTIDELINGEPLSKDPKHGFIVAFFEMGEKGRFNYMSNCQREDIVTLLKEMIKRFEGMPETPVTRA